MIAYFSNERSPIYPESQKLDYLFDILGKAKEILFFAQQFECPPAVQTVVGLLHYTWGIERPEGNSGEVYDASTKRWLPGGSDRDWIDEAVQWDDLGAAGIGGCCRVGPKTISGLRHRLLKRKA